MRKVAFLPRGFEEFNQWAIEDKKIYVKIVTLIKDILHQAINFAFVSNKI